MRHEFLAYMRPKMSDSELLPELVYTMGDDMAVGCFDLVCRVLDIPQPTGNDLNKQWLLWYQSTGNKCAQYLQPDYTGALDASREFNRQKELK